MTQATRGARAASPDQEQNEASNRGVAIPQFLPPRPRPQDPQPDPGSLHPAEATAETRGEHPDDEGFGEENFAVHRALAEATSTPASTDTPLKPLVTKAQVDAAKGLVQAMLLGATTLVNRRLREHEGDDAFEMNAKELEAIGLPLARIIARRSPIPTGGNEASDLADGIAAVVGVIGYTMRQLTRDKAGPAPVQIVAQEQAAAPAPAGPGAMLSPLDPAYRVV